MATKNIAWQTGNGNIIADYIGSGDGIIAISSSAANNLLVSRSQNLVVSTTKGTPTRNKTLTVNQRVSPNVLPSYRAANVGLLTKNGGINTSQIYYRYSDYAEIPAGVNGFYCHAVFPITANDWAGLCIYNADKTLIGWGENLENGGNPEKSGLTYLNNFPNAKYIRFSPAYGKENSCYVEWVNVSFYQKIAYSVANNVGLLKADGTVELSQTSYRYSDYIEIPTDASIISAVKIFPVTSTWSGLQIFDKNKNFLGNGENLGNQNGLGKGETVISHFPGAKYLRFSPALPPGDNTQYITLFSYTKI